MAAKLAACGAILSGGESSRMGSNKALLQVGGEPLIQRLARRFTAWFEQVVVVTNDPTTYHFLDLPMVSDRYPGLGPLGGLEAGLQASHYEHAFFCAVDMPFVSEGLVRYMVEQAPGYDIVVPVMTGEFEPMHAVYGKGCLEAVTGNIDARRLKLISFYDKVRRRDLSEEEVRRFGEPDRLFFNCNAPADLEQARRWAEEESPWS